jgi:hypothetical protein
MPDLPADQHMYAYGAHNDACCIRAEHTLWRLYRHGRNFAESLYSLRWAELSFRMLCGSRDQSYVTVQGDSSSRTETASMAVQRIRQKTEQYRTVQNAHDADSLTISTTKNSLGAIERAVDRQQRLGSPAIAQITPTKPG